MRGLAVVRNKDGYIRANNYELLSEECKRELEDLVAKDGYVTADSYPDKDERFSEEKRNANT